MRICRQTAVQQLAEHEKGIEGARGQIAPLRQSIEQQLQAMKASKTPPSGFTGTSAAQRRIVSISTWLYLLIIGGFIAPQR